MKPNGYIRKFGTYTHEQILRMREDLGLRSSPALLERMASFYQHLKKDPLVEELRLLDGFTAAVHAADRSLRIEELYTNDPAAAATYADLMRKRHELAPEARRAPTLPEAAAVATAYLHRAGKKVAPKDLHLLLGEHFSPRGLCGRVSALGVEGSRFFLQALPCDRLQAAPASDDVLVLFLKEELESYRSYYVKLSRLLMRPEAAALCKQLRAVGDEGLLYEMLSVSRGLWIDLRRLSVGGIAAEPVTALTGRYVGLRLARVSHGDYPALIASAEADGIRAVAFASLQSVPEITVCEREGHALSIPTDLLRALSDCRPMRAKLPDEAPIGTAPICRRPITERTCAYMHAAAPEETLHVSELETTAAAAVRPTAQFFRSALFSVLLPILEVAAAGGAYDRQRLSVALELPEVGTCETRCGEAVASVLGLYRAQAELGVPAPLLRMETSPQLPHPTLTVFSTFEGPVSAFSRWKTAGARVFLYSFPISAEGLPDFGALRRVLKQLEQMHLRQEIFSYAVLCNEALTDVLARMGSERLCCRVTDPASVAEGPQTLAILIEAYAAEGWTRVGEIEETAKEQPAPTEADCPPLLWSGADSLIASQNTEVLLLSLPQDTDAEVLASILCERGAHVTLHTTAEEERLALSRALLGTQVLLLGKGVSLPSDRYVDFALDTMRRAGGCVLALGSDPAPAGAVSLSDGLTEEILSQILAPTEC